MTPKHLVKPKIVFPKGNDYVVANVNCLNKIIRSDDIVNDYLIYLIMKILESGTIISGKTLKNYNLIEPKPMTVEIKANGRTFNGEILKCALSKIFSATTNYGLVANHQLNPKSPYLLLKDIKTREDIKKGEKFYYVGGLVQLLKEV